MAVGYVLLCAREWVKWDEGAQKWDEGEQKVCSVTHPDAIRRDE